MKSIGRTLLNQLESGDGCQKTFGQSRRAAVLGYGGRASSENVRTWRLKRGRCGISGRWVFRQKEPLFFRAPLHDMIHRIVCRPEKIGSPQYDGKKTKGAWLLAQSISLDAFTGAGAASRSMQRARCGRAIRIYRGCSAANAPTVLRSPAGVNRLPLISGWSSFTR